MAYDIVQFKSGNKNNIPSQIVPGTVYFAIDGDKGSLYLDFDATHRILMSEHYAAEAGKATYDSTGTQSIVNTYIKGIEFDGTTDTAKVTAILERGSGDTSTTVLLPNAGASSAGIITAGAQTIAGAKTFTGAFTASGGVTFSNASFNYSGFEARSNDVATVVWFSDNTTKGKPVYDNDFTYNPSTNTLTVTNVSGTAEYATKATGDTTSIKTTYISNITTDSANHKLTFYKGDGGSTDKELNFVRLSGDTMTGDLNFASIGTFPVASGETYPIKSKGIYWYGSSDGAGIFYRIDSGNEGNLIIQSTDDGNEKVIFRTTASNGDFFAINSQSRYIYPINNKTGYLGTSSNRWAAIYAEEIYEDTTNIKDKYISGWSTTDTVITVEKGSGATETINSPWLPLIGGNVTGHVNFGNTVSIDSATIRELVVTGAASFANHANFNTITVGGLAVFNANVGIGTSSPASKLHINGSLLKITNNGNTVTIGSNNSGWCHFENSANIAFYFNKKVQAVTGFAIYDGHGDWQDGYLKIINKDGGDAYLEFNRNGNANWRFLNSGGTFYLQSDYTTAKGSYYNVLTANYDSGNITLRGSLNVGATKGGIGLANTNASLGIGISLYGGPTTGAPTYGLMFAGTATFGTHGGVTSDWATYFTMNDATTRGWIFRRGSTNVASINGDGKLYLGAVTSSANPGVYWNQYVESATDASDVSAIYQIKSGVAGGTELRISQANDSGDVINICSPYYIYLNSKKAFTINDTWLRINDGGGFTSGVYFGSSIVRTDGQLQVGSSGEKFYANSSGNGYFSNTLGIGGTNTGYKLYVNGTSYLNGVTTVYGPLRVGRTDAAANTGYATADVGSNNYIAFYGLYADGAGGYNHTYIGESIYGDKTTTHETSELLLFKGNDPAASSGPDRIRLLAGQVDIQVYAAALSGTWDTIRQTNGTQVANFANGKITLNGNLHIKGANGTGIYYQGSQATTRMIRFVDNTADVNGNGISIGGGGLTVLGSGESADTLLSQLSLTASGGTETTYIGSDNNIEFYPGQNSYDASARITMSAGRIYVGLDGNTTRENQIVVRSGAGTMYMYSVASNTGNRGIYVPAHGTGAAKSVFTVDTNNNINFFGNVTNALAMGRANLNKTNIVSWVDTSANIHKSGFANEMQYARFFTQDDQTPATYQLPAVDTHNLIFSMDNATSYNRILSLDVRTNKIFTRAKTSGTWGSWEQLVRVTQNASIGNANRPAYIDANGLATAVSWYPNYCTINGGNTANYSWHRFATCTTGTGQWVDRDVIVAIRSRYNGGPYGIIKLSVRTNATNAAMNCSATWIIRYGFGAGDVIITPTTGTTTTGTDTRFNAYIKCGTYPRRYAYILEGSNNGWSLINSNEVNDTTTSDKKTSTEVVASITGTVATDGGIVQTANNATNIYSSASSTKAYVLGTTTASSANHATVYNASVYTEGSVLFGAAWNDYAEYRISTVTEPGRCVKEVGDDTLVLSTERLQPGCEIVSDTFGFAIGETKKAQTPIAASGRVLAYPLEDREEFRNHIGKPVCSGPNGTVSIMTKEEIREYPHCIIGTISAIPDYETWGTNNVAINGRIWIRIK